MPENPPPVDLTLHGLEEEDTFPDDEGDLSTPAALFAACCRRVRRFLEARIDVLFTRAHDDLFEGASNAPNNDVERDCFDAMQELHRVKPAIAQGFVSGVLDAMDQLWTAEFGAQPDTASEGIDAENLSLVDTQSMEDEVQVVRITTRASPALDAGEHALAYRLSQVLPSPIEAKSNPVGVANICMAFHASVQNLGAERATRRALFQALDATIVKDLAELHQELNDLLVAQGIAPKIDPGRPQQMGRSDREAQRPESEKAADPGEPGRGTEPHGEAVPPDPVPATSRGAAEETNLAGTQVAGAEVEIPFARASASVRHLMDLERALSSPGTGPLPVSPKPTEMDERHAVDAALARIQQSGEAEGWGEIGPYAFGVRVRAALAKQGIELKEPAVADSLDVVSTLLENILADPFVQATAKPLIRRLGLPLGRVALADGTFFTSDSHAARETINRLGRLFVPKGDDGKAAFPLRKVDAILGSVLAAPRVDRAVFAHAANELGGLLAQQAAHFEAEAARLRDSLDRQQAVREERGSAAVNEAPALSPAEAANEGWQHALESVSRLESGAVLILAVESATPVPATLAWRSPDGGVFVFADMLGRRAASFVRRGLAVALWRGEVRHEEAARMPIVDRAMCGVLEDLHHRLEHKANRDPLTGLANLKRFEADLARTMKSGTGDRRRHHVCSLGLAYLDQIAARLGQKAVDTLIEQYAPVLERQIGQVGSVAHVDHGRFAVSLPNTSRSEVLALMERHRRSIELAKCVYGGEAVELAVSIGVVSISPGATDPAVVLEAANSAYDKALAGSPMGLHVEEALAGERYGAFAEGMPGIAEYIAEGRLSLRCQRVEPVDANSDALPYYEVLLGVREESGRIGPPGGVIVAAERAGQIAELDRWVVAETMRWMGANSEKLASLKGLAINLSGATLSDAELVRFVVDQIEHAGVPPERIMFEVTESTAIESLSVAREFIETLRAHGCRFALDDFGAGHASFSYLKLLPVDTVKIDGLFVKEMESNPADEAMVRSINEIAKLLGKQTVAEFVENDAILERLRELGVDYAQGYGIEQPIAIDELV